MTPGIASSSGAELSPPAHLLLPLLHLFPPPEQSLTSTPAVSVSTAFSALLSQTHLSISQPSISARASVSHLSALSVIPLPSLSHFLFCQHLSLNLIFSSLQFFFNFFFGAVMACPAWEIGPDWSCKNQKKRVAMQLTESLYAQQAPFRTGVPAVREIGNPAFWAPSSIQISPATPDTSVVFWFARTVHLLLVYKCMDMVL